MAQVKLSAKHLQITKANTVVVIMVAVAAFITTFSLVAARAVLVKRAYQSRVIHEKKIADDQLKKNIEAVDKLKAAYNSFVSNQENIIKGSSTGTGERDGDNAKIVLDALPSSYDFPALATTLEKILSSRNLSDGSITGSDDEIAQKEAAASATGPLEIPFQLNANGTYVAIQELLKEFDVSIRPIQITVLRLSGTEAEIQLDVTAKTFYQPEKQLKITKKSVQ